MSETKARSRLAKTKESNATEKNESVGLRSFRKSHRGVSLSGYLRHLPAFILGLLGYIGLAYIFLRVHPDQLKNVLVSNSYLPVLALFWVANFFMLSFVFLNSRRGLFASVLATLFLFLKLQSVEITSSVIMGLLIPFVILELVLSLVTHQRSKT